MSISLEKVTSSGQEIAQFLQSPDLLDDDQARLLASLFTILTNRTGDTYEDLVITDVSTIKMIAEYKLLRAQSSGDEESITLQSRVLEWSVQFLRQMN